MVLRSSNEFMAELAVDTLKRLGKPGVILGSYTNVNSKALNNSSLKAYADHCVLWSKWAPHEWLMPRCSLIVHHGGCGTTAASLRAGKPVVVTPVAHDQFYWGAKEIGGK